jgi:hypothetical protein
MRCKQRHAVCCNETPLVHSGKLIAVFIYDSRGVPQFVAPEKAGAIDPSHLAFPPWEDAGPYLRGEKF